jgi:hypothetical protein
MRFVVAALAALCLVFQNVSPGHAQDAWPSRNVTIIVPFTAGGTADLFARLVAGHMQQTFGQSFVVENRGGSAAISVRPRSRRRPMTATRSCWAPSAPTPSTRRSIQT